MCLELKGVINKVWVRGSQGQKKKSRQTSRGQIWDPRCALRSSSTDEKEKSHVLDDLKLQTVKLYHLGDLLHCSVPSAWLSPISLEVLFCWCWWLYPNIMEQHIPKEVKIQHHGKLLSFWFPWARKGSLSTPKTGKIHLEFLHPLKKWGTCGSFVAPAGPIAMTFSTCIKSP